MNYSVIQRRRSSLLAIGAIIAMVFIIGLVVGFVFGNKFCFQEDLYFRRNVSMCLLEIKWAIERGDESNVISAIRKGGFKHAHPADPLDVVEVAYDLMRERKTTD